MADDKKQNPPSNAVLVQKSGQSVHNRQHNLTELTWPFDTKTFTSYGILLPILHLFTVFHFFKLQAYTTRPKKNR